MIRPEKARLLPTPPSFGPTRSRGGPCSLSKADKEEGSKPRPFLYRNFHPLTVPTVRSFGSGAIPCRASEARAGRAAEPARSAELPRPEGGGLTGRERPEPSSRQNWSNWSQKKTRARMEVWFFVLTDFRFCSQMRSLTKNANFRFVNGVNGFVAILDRQCVV